MFCSNLNAKNPFASATQTAALLRSGVRYRRDRMEAADMITTDEVVELAGTSRVTINAWTKSGPGLEVAALALEPAIWPALQPWAKSLSTVNASTPG